jgi:hypothetical protein
MKYPGAPSTVAQPDHSNYLQIELPRHIAKASVSKTAGAKAPVTTATAKSSTAPANLVLNSIEWQQLVRQLGTLQAPAVSRKPSGAAIRDKASQLAPGNGGHGARTLP